MVTAAGSPSLPQAMPGSDEPLHGNYFVSAYPPFSVWTKDHVRAVERLLEVPSSSNDIPLGIYIHIPFCAKRCDYCYYLAYADKTSEQMDAYLAALTKELELYAKTAALAGRSASFVYFGGGTPSLLSTHRMRRLFSDLQRSFPWTDAREICFECAPKTVSAGKLEILRDAGITRISLGVQQLDDAILRKNGRIHLVHDVERAYEEIRRVGFDLVNIDLMVGMVGETEASFDRSLERVIQMQPESVTIYPLEIPHNTPLYRNLCEQCVIPLPVAWETKRARLARGFGRLEVAGYTLRSAYAAVRDLKRHVFVYQDEQYHGSDLLGLGVASFSYFAGTHYQNVASFDEYVAKLDQDRLPFGRAYELAEDERLVREFVLQLKLGQVRAGDFREKFGTEIVKRFAEPLRRFADQGWLSVNSEGVTLTRAGLLRVDRLIPAFYLPKHQADRYW